MSDVAQLPYRGGFLRIIVALSMSWLKQMLHSKAELFSTVLLCSQMWGPGVGAEVLSTMTTLAALRVLGTIHNAPHEHVQLLMPKRLREIASSRRDICSEKNPTVI